MLFSSTGILKYEKGDVYDYKLALYIDREITRYYRSLMPKWIITNSQMYPPHVSIVRKEIPINLDAWGKYEGQSIKFYYENIVRFGKVYCWLNVFCKQLEEIRIELGLPVGSLYTRPPEGFEDCFHSTIGNFKILE